MKIRPEKQLSLFSASAADNADRAPLRFWIDEGEPWADNFAGGGGVGEALKRLCASLGIKKRGPDVAVNHNAEALAMHEANHPECAHYCENIIKFDPAKASGGRRYALAWFSPTCIYFSQAKGGPLDKEATKVRGLAWLACSWAASDARPRVICLENVKQFIKWGPLHRQHNNGCSDELALSNAKTTRKGKVIPQCRKGCAFMRAIKSKIGSLFNRFVSRLGKYYRYVSWRVLKAHHYGAPTSRERMFLIASDSPVAWPEPTHGPGRAKPYRTAAQCIDWSVECPSIFERAKPLAPKTCARIVAGIHKFVFGAARPFIVPTSYGDKGGTDVRVSSVDEPARTICGNRSALNVVSPIVMKAKTYGGGGNDAKSAEQPLGTITTSKRGEHAIAVPIVVRTAHGDVDKSGHRRGQGSHTAEAPLGTIMASGTDFAIATPYLVHRSNGERNATETTSAQKPRIYDAQAPLGTIVAQGIKHCIALPVLIKNNGGNNDRCGSAGQEIDTPLDTIATRDQKSIAMLHLLKLRGTSESHVAASAHPIEEPLPTISAGGIHFAQVAAHLIRFNGQRDGEARGQELDEPISTIDTARRFALVTVTMAAEVCSKALRVAKFLGYDHPIILEIDGEEWILVDIGFRMLGVRELFLCQGFPPDYIVDPMFRGKKLTKTAAIKCVGNSVPPQLAEAVAHAAVMTIEYERRAA